MINNYTTNTTTTERVSANFTNNLKNSSINTISSSAAQSAINGDSFTDALKQQGKNILIYTVAKVGANEIGRAYHPADGSAGIGKPLQLTLHAGLGCAVGAATGGNCGSGAIAGVVGEQTAETANQYG